MQTYRIYVFDCIFGFKSLKTYDFVVKLSWWSYTFDCFWINVWSFSFSWFFHRFDCCFCGFLWFFLCFIFESFFPQNFFNLSLVFIIFFRFSSTPTASNNGPFRRRWWSGAAQRRWANWTAWRARRCASSSGGWNRWNHQKWWFSLWKMVVFPMVHADLPQKHGI